MEYIGVRSKTLKDSVKKTKKHIYMYVDACVCVYIQIFVSIY